MPTARTVAAWIEQLTPTRARQLQEARGWDAGTLIQSDVGWSHEQQAFVFPILHGEQVVDVKFYRPASKTRKWWRLAGGTTRLATPYQGDVDRSRRVLLCAGEPDMWTAWQAGWNAITFTGGEGSLPPASDLELLRDCDLYIAYDADPAGLKGTQSAADELAKFAKSVWLVDLSSLGLPAGVKDVSDVLRHPRLGGSSIRRVVDAALLHSAADEDTVSSWTPVPLGPVLRDENQDEAPTIGLREDAIPLLYAGKINALNSESEAGKTWFALLACHEQLINDETVLYIDFEDSPRTFTERLRAMGMPDAMIEERFVYVRPDDPLDEREAARLLGLVDERQPTLAVIDGVTEAMSLHGLSINDNDDAAKFIGLLARPLARKGPAVLVLDHVPKDNSRRRFAIGAQHKLSGLDGAVYRLDNTEPFGRGLTGRSTVRVAKDRPGFVRPHAADGRIAELVLKGAQDGTVEVLLYPPSFFADAPDGVAIRISPSATRILAILRAANGTMTVAMLTTALAADQAGMPLQGRTVQNALTALQKNGKAELVGLKEAGKAARWRAVQSDD